MSEVVINKNPEEQKYQPLLLTGNRKRAKYLTHFKTNCWGRLRRLAGRHPQIPEIPRRLAPHCPTPGLLQLESFFGWVGLLPDRQTVW